MPGAAQPQWQQFAPRINLSVAVLGVTMVTMYWGLIWDLLRKPLKDSAIMILKHVFLFSFSSHRVVNETRRLVERN